MHVVDNIDFRCSECLSPNYETVTHGKYPEIRIYKRCLDCGHKGTESTLTNVFMDDERPITFVFINNEGVKRTF